MDKEQIEQAAYSFSETLTLSNGNERAEAMRGFISGANWRINSVWHTSKERPVNKGERKFCDIFYISKKGYPRTNTYSVESGFLLYRGEEWKDVKLWAYVEDLLPHEPKTIDELIADGTIKRGEISDLLPDGKEDAE